VGLQRHIKDELKFRDVSENTAFDIFSNVNYHTQLTAIYVWVCVCVICVGFVMCGCLDNCVDVLVICVLCFYCLYSFVYVYLLLFVCLYYRKDYCHQVKNQLQ